MKKEKVNFRDQLSTVTAEGKRAWIYAKKPSGRYYIARNIVGFALLAFLFGAPFVKRQSFAFDQYFGTQIFDFWHHFSPARCHHFWLGISDWCSFCRTFYSCFWKVILWVGLSANRFYGIDFQANRILDRGRLQQTKSS